MRRRSSCAERLEPPRFAAAHAAGHQRVAPVAGGSTSPRSRSNRCSSRAPANGITGSHWQLQLAVVVDLVACVNRRRRPRPAAGCTCSADCDVEHARARRCRREPTARSVSPPKMPGADADQDDVGRVVELEAAADAQRRLGVGVRQHRAAAATLEHQLETRAPADRPPAHGRSARHATGSKSSSR